MLIRVKLCILILIFTVSFIGNVFLIWTLQKTRYIPRETIITEKLEKFPELHIFTAIPIYNSPYPSWGKMFQRQFKMNETENYYNQIFLDTNGQRFGLLGMEESFQDTIFTQTPPETFLTEICEFSNYVS